jgi:plastocyanin
MDLTLKGYYIGWYGCNYLSLSEAADGTHAASIEGAHLALVNTTTGALQDISGAVTDKNGVVSVTFPTAGNYMLTAYIPAQDISDGSTPIIMPLATVVVTEEPTDTTAPKLTGTGAGNLSATGATISFTSDEAGTYYYVVLPASDTAPTAATVKAGKAGRLRWDKQLHGRWPDGFNSLQGVRGCCRRRNNASDLPR